MAVGNFTVSVCPAVKKVLAIATDRTQRRWDFVHPRLAAHEILVDAVGFQRTMLAFGQPSLRPSRFRKGTFCGLLCLAHLRYLLIGFCQSFVCCVLRTQQPANPVSCGLQSTLGRFARRLQLADPGAHCLQLDLARRLGALQLCDLTTCCL